MRVNIVFVKEAGKRAAERMNFIVSSISGIETLSCFCLGCRKEEILFWLGSLYKIKKSKVCQIYEYEEKNAGCEVLYKALIPELKKDAQAVTFVYGNEDGFYTGSMAAALLKRQCLPDTTEISAEDETAAAVRKIYSAHAEGLFNIVSGSVVIISENGERYPYERNYCMPAAAESLSPAGQEKTLQRIEIKEKTGEADISSAGIVFIGGRGLKSKENFERMAETAQKLHAAWGCTRAAALSGWCGYDRVVGISGQSLSADICVLFGVSGAAPLMAGLEHVKKIIAVNKDKKAPVFDDADDGIIGDCIQVLKAMGGQDD